MVDRPVRTKQDINQAENNISKKEDNHQIDFLSTGSTLLNLAASQRAKGGGWARGRIGNIVGDGSSGKTLEALEVGAHCIYNMQGTESNNFPKVKKVTVVYNNVEGVMDFPIEDMYGERFNDEVIWIRTGTIQEFGKDFFRRVQDLKTGELLLYIVDSWDALDSEEEYEAFLKTIEKDTKQEGSFDLGKQKYGSKRFFKTLCSQIEGDNGRVKKDCTLLIVSHSKKKIGVTFGEKVYRAGGDALNFYTHQVCWLADCGKIPKTVEGIKIIKGINVRAKFKRNKVAKPFREAEFSILFDYGIDDISSMVEYLYGPQSKEITDLFGQSFKKYETLVKYVEQNSLEDQLSDLVFEKWKRIELGASPIDRKKRYRHENAYT